MTAVMTRELGSSLSCPPRFCTPRRLDRPTHGDRAARVARQLGISLMPWQQHVLDLALEVDPKTGRLAYRTVVLTVPRQSGKTLLLLTLTTHRALGFGPGQQIAYTAQSRSEARLKWEDEWLPILNDSALSRQYRTRLTNGHEALLWKNRSKFSLIATTKKAGHGKSLDLGVVDEAFAQSDSRLEQALSPTMVTRPEPQLWVVSTAGTPESVWLRSKVDTFRELALAGDTESGVCGAEWSAPDDADPGDPATWWGCMPALGLTQPESAIAAEFTGMPPDDFARAYLNQWVAQGAESVIGRELWGDALDALSTVTNPVALAVDVNPDRSWAAIGSCGARPDGVGHLEVIDHRRDTGWVAGRVGELAARHRPVVVVVDPAGQAGQLVGEIERELAARRVRCEVKKVSAREHAAACGQLMESLKARGVRHIGQPELDAAVGGAQRRPLGDAWAWSRRSSQVDICPLVAVTLAAWGFEEFRPRRSGGVAVANTAPVAAGGPSIFRPEGRLRL